MFRLAGLMGFVCLWCLSLPLTAQDRVLGHISKWDGLYPASIVIHNPMRKTGNYTIEAYDSSGTAVGVVSGSVQPGQTRDMPASDFFGGRDAAFAIVSGSTNVHVGVVYRRRGTTQASVFVPESRDASQVRRAFPSTLEKTWNGFAAVNLGRSAAEVQVHYFDDRGTVIAQHQIEAALPPRAKTLVILDASEITSGGCEIVSSQPISLVGLSGTQDHQVFTVMPTQPISTDTRTRVIPHLTRATSHVNTRLFIGNSGQATQAYVFEGFDEAGRLVATAGDRLPAGTTLGVTPKDLFHRSDISHFRFRADASVSVFAAYHSADSTGFFSAVPATHHQSRFWRLFPDHAADIWDGFAVINVGDTAADIWMGRSDAASSPTRIIDDLPQWGKGLFVIPATPGDPTPVDITSSEPMIVLSLRGRIDDTAVWSSPAKHVFNLEQRRFDFQNEPAPLAAGFTPITPQDDYSEDLGFGFTTPPGNAEDGSDHQWTIFGRRISVEDAIPPSVLSDATIDCIRTGRRGALQFRVDVSPGTYDVTLWIGDVTTPLHQIRASVNGATADFERLDINTSRGQFWQEKIPFFGFTAPRTLRVDASNGHVDCQVTGMPESDQAVEWTYLQDEDPTQDPYTRTVVLVPEYRLAAIGAMTIARAQDPPLSLQDGTLVIADAPADPVLQDAVDAFNQSDLIAATNLFDQLEQVQLQPARAAGLFWIAGHPAVFEDEGDLMDRARSILDLALAHDPLNPALERLALQMDMARQALSYRRALGYAANEQSSSENMGRSCALTEAFTPDHPYYRKGQIIWLRNRGGLDPRRVTASWERAQWLARQLDPEWGDVNPFVRLYATDTWSNDFGPWRVIDWPNLIGEGPQWARALVSNLNIWIDLFEWWGIHRQSPEGDIGGGWTDDVEIMPAFGLMGLALRNASSINEYAVLRFADGIWNSHIIDRERGYQAQYADVEHTAEPTGNILHVVPMMRPGDPQGLERIMISAKTFSEFFLADATASPLGHRHLKGNHMSATQIALSQDNPDHRTDIPLNGRVTTPFPFLVWATGNPGIADPLQDWVDAWIADSERTDKNKPAGVFPNAVWCPPGFDEIGYPDTSDWFSAHNGFGQFTEFPKYQYYLYNLAAFYHVLTGDAAYLSVHDTLRDLTLMWHAQGRPDVPPTPESDPGLWAGKQLQTIANGSILNLKLATGRSDWDAYLEEFGTSYGKFVLDPADISSIDELAQPAETVTDSWPYRTTEGVMTDRILVPGWADVISYYIGADVFSVFFGMPIYAVSWENTSRLFAAAVTHSSDATLDATTYLFAQEPRNVTARFWHLIEGQDYVLEGGASQGPGMEPETFDQSVAFTYSHRGDGVSFVLPPRTQYGIRVRPVRDPASAQMHAETPVLRPDLGLSARDIVVDTSGLKVTVHNLGAQTANNVVINVYKGFSAEGDPIATATVPEIEAPIDLVPRTQLIQFALPASESGHPKDAGPFLVVLDPDDHIDENCEQNNTAVWTPGATDIGAPPMIIDVEGMSGDRSFRVVGRHFLPDAEALVFGDPHAAFDVTFIDSEEIHLTIAPELQAKTYLVSVKNPDGQISNLVPLNID